MNKASLAGVQNIINIHRIIHYRGLIYAGIDSPNIAASHSRLVYLVLYVLQEWWHQSLMRLDVDLLDFRGQSFWEEARDKTR